MIIQYPELSEEEIERSGKHYIHCDSEGCDAQSEVGDVEHAVLGGRDHYFAAMPEGWATSDPEHNALAGAADYCPEHVEQCPAATSGTEQPPVVDEGTAAPSKG